MASRAGWALELVEACVSERISRETLNREILAKLRLHDLPQLQKLLTTEFSSIELQTEIELDREMARYRSLASSGGGNPKIGESLFFGQAGCAACHVLFGKGGSIGPDLTSYDRSDLNAMLLAIVRPSAEIREGYEHNILSTKDGRILSGFKVEENPKVLILRGLDGQDHCGSPQPNRRPHSCRTIPDALWSARISYRRGISSLFRLSLFYHASQIAFPFANTV